MRTVSRLAGLVVLIALLAAACGGDGGSNEATTAAATSAEAGELTGRVWQWQGTAYSDDSEAVPDDPGSYTIEFFADGSYSANADCNVMNGPFQAGDGVIEIQQGAMTQAACPPGSLSDTFVNDLTGAATYEVSGDELRLDIKADVGSMSFTASG